MDKKSFFSQMFTPGTMPCTVFGIAIGFVFAILCLTLGVGKTLLIGIFCLCGAFIGGVKDKGAFVRKVLGALHRED